jgi:deoxycytidine triphosphate deaminase
MLDDFRIGLHMQDSIRTLSGAVDLSLEEAPVSETRSLYTGGMRRGEWGLGMSLERISLSRRLIGFMNTRSKYARLGLELMCSSWMVAPGFGALEAANIVFEIHASSDLVGFRADECYAYIFLCELDEPMEGESRNYSTRFPLDLQAPTGEEE